MSKRIEWIYCILVHCSLLYISQIPKNPYFTCLFASIICTEDVYFRRSVACSSTTKGVFFFKLPICLLDEQFKLEFTVYNYSLHMWLEKIFSTNHSCLNDTKSVYLFQTLTVYPIYPSYPIYPIYQLLSTKDIIAGKR